MQDSLHWLPVRQCIMYKICTIVCNCFNDSALYLHICTKSVIRSVQILRLRSADHGNLVVPHSDTDRFGRRGFPVAEPNQWNKLPLHILKVYDKPEQFTLNIKNSSVFQQHWLALLRRAIAKILTSTLTLVAWFYV